MSSRPLAWSIGTTSSLPGYLGGAAILALGARQARLPTGTACKREFLGFRRVVGLRGRRCFALGRTVLRFMEDEKYVSSDPSRSLSSHNFKHRIGRNVVALKLKLEALALL